MTKIEAMTYEVSGKQKKVRKTMQRIVLGDYASHCITPTGTVAEAMDAYWGKRCPDHHTDCPACKAWDEYDDMVKNYQEEGH
jgi:hypothetical protein